jgi:[glutamine synthetase] adenylyltransferase / [glutamine synthetase]-adenylyl-L-tyrosine phosphorylase
LLALAERSAAPGEVTAVLHRLVDERPDALDRLMSGGDTTELAHTVVAVSGASNTLGRLMVTDPLALDVLGALDDPVTVQGHDPAAVARWKRLALLRIAARDLLGFDGLDAVGSALADIAELVLEQAVDLAGGSTPLAVIGMGKLGGRELNYASDVDVVFVTDTGPDDPTARRVLQIAGRAFRVDADLRPEGRAGPLTRTLEGYRAYWGRWAATWELQALLKARAVAGDGAVGARFQRAAEDELWARRFSADELAAVRSMKARAEDLVRSRGFDGREIKRGRGGIRDVEFAVQLLQLVHGRHDPGIRQRATLAALAELSVAGYIAADDAALLSEGYRFLRTLEHRLQLVDEDQTHAVPVDPAARRRISLAMGFTDDPSASATARFDDALRRWQREVRAVHERLFFRPLLEAFSTLEPSGSTPEASGSPDQRQAGGRVFSPTLSSEAIAERLAAFGFPNVARTRAAVEDLAGGLTRSSRLMAQLLPLILDWLSLTPDPDLGLLGLRSLVMNAHRRAALIAAFRESPEAARRLCLLLGSSRLLAEAIQANPELIATVADDDALRPTTPPQLVEQLEVRLGRNDDTSWRRRQLVRVRQDQMVRIAARDLLDLDDVTDTGRALTELGETLLVSALGVVDPPMPFAVVALGRLGGSEMSYASDLDVLFVYDDGADADGEEVAESMLRFMHGPSPAQRIATLDLGLRPEGGQGRLARNLDGYRLYFGRWAQVWERQALVRARMVAGNRDLGERFMEIVSRFVWGEAFGDDEVREVRRMKARVERERIPAREDPQFHLKLGRGSLSDVEWTVQLLQLRHRVPGTSTLLSLDALAAQGAIALDEADALRQSYRFCEHTRNRWHLVGALPGGAAPGDALPTDPDQLSHLARSLHTTPSALRDDYRRVTRRARRVVERVFYGVEPRR